ncbi:hypothetical protein [Paludibacterium denitrificans]|uniref:Uncharacterized protein n=1 Tax=Paludibacterium denitrificans TaxID=2675226 RepID=A0A844GHD5_9NEIS|nr:hypothetical protein [Paludibacterium denitrificans]MTD34074.1 hypothetical protein [Paludibacterium denitrificans]
MWPETDETEPNPEEKQKGQPQLNGRRNGFDRLESESAASHEAAHGWGFSKPLSVRKRTGKAGHWTRHWLSIFFIYQEKNMAMELIEVTDEAVFELRSAGWVIKSPIFRNGQVVFPVFKKKR